MVASGLESVLIGHPVDGQHGTIGSGERVASRGNGSDVFGFLANLFLRSTFLHFDAIFALESVGQCNRMLD